MNVKRTNNQTQKIKAAAATEIVKQQKQKAQQRKVLLSPIKIK